MADIDQDLTEHITELRARVTRVGILLLFLLPLLFYFSPDLIRRFWEGVVDEEMFVYSPMEWILLRLGFSLILSLVIIYPYAMLELYLFAKPGLYESERKFLKFAIIPSYLLFLAGSYISYKFLVPFLYTLSAGNPFYSAEKTILSVLKLSFSLGFLLQIPLAIFLLDRFKVLSYETLRDLRLPIYLILLAIVFNSSADIGGLTMVALALSFFLMFEFSLFVIGLSKR